MRRAPAVEPGDVGVTIARSACRRSPRKCSASDQILPAAIIAGGPWNRGRVIRVEADAGIGRHRDGRPSDGSRRAGASGVLLALPPR